MVVPQRHPSNPAGSEGGGITALLEAMAMGRPVVATDRPVLRLITCGGTPDPVTRMYPDNTIVYARLAL